MNHGAERASQWQSAIKKSVSEFVIYRTLRKFLLVKMILVYNLNSSLQNFASPKAGHLMDTPDHFKLKPDHSQSIKALAEEIGCPVEEVNTVYVSELQKLKSSARIQDYLHVLARKKVRDALHH